jgi:hypothetical protein
MAATFFSGIFLLLLNTVWIQTLNIRVSCRVLYFGATAARPKYGYYLFSLPISPGAKLQQDLHPSFQDP